VKWWRVRLSRKKAEQLEREARMLIVLHGDQARQAVLGRVGALRKSNKEAIRLARLAGCIAELHKQRPAGGKIGQALPHSTNELRTVRLPNAARWGDTPPTTQG